MGTLDIEVSEVKRLVELVETYGLEELTVTHEDLSVTVRGRVPRTAVVQVSSAVEPAAAQPLLEEAEEVSDSENLSEQPVELEGNIHDIRAPLVGVFYRSPAPDAPPFIEVGDEIEVGAEIGIIEAMKVFSPIPSDVAGVVVEIPAANGKLVQEGDVLVRVRVREE